MATADDDSKRPGSFKIEVTAYRCRCGHEWTSKGLNKERPASVRSARARTGTRNTATGVGPEPPVSA